MLQLSGEVAGTSVGLFHVWFDALGCRMRTFLSQLSDLHVPVLESAANRLSIVQGSSGVFGLSFSLAFAFLVRRFGFLRPAGGPFNGRQCRHGFKDFRSQHEERMDLHAAMRKLMEGVVHGPFAIQKVHDCAPNLAICLIL